MPFPVLEDLHPDERFLRELCEQLHTLAQPWTLLQTRLEVALILGNHANPEMVKMLLSTLSEEVERACGNFHSLQLLAGSALRKYTGEADSATGSAA